MNVRASYEDEPIVQPMYWNHKDELAYSVPNQYYFGPDLIVAPITQRAQPHHHSWPEHAPGCQLVGT